MYICTYLDNRYVVFDVEVRTLQLFCRLRMYAVAHIVCDYTKTCKAYGNLNRECSINSTNYKLIHNHMKSVKNACYLQ